MTRKNVNSNSKILKPIHLHWVDSMCEQGWNKNQENANMNCETVGFFVRENKDSIVIALNYCHDGTGYFGHFMEIPKVSIKKRRWIK